MVRHKAGLTAIAHSSMCAYSDSIYQSERNVKDDTINSINNALQNQISQFVTSLTKVDDKSTRSNMTAYPR